MDFRAFLEPKGFLSTLCETRFNLVTTGADLQDPMPSELAKMYHETNFITVGPLLQQAKFCLMLQVCRKIASSRKGDISEREVKVEGCQMIGGVFLIFLSVSCPHIIDCHSLFRDLRLACCESSEKPSDAELEPVMEIQKAHEAGRQG